MKIYAPVKNATGTWATVRFINGVGETDNPNLIKWFKTHGYRVEETITQEQAIEQVLEEIDSTEPDLEAMTPLELREWAKANGYGSVIRNTRNKEKLLELIRGE